MFAKNWKTTVAGFIAALPVFCQTLGVSFGHVGTVTGEQAIGAVGALLLGFYAKDKNVTGGAVQQ